MATQSEAQCIVEINAAIAILHELRKHGGVNSASPLLNYISRESTLLNVAAEGDFSIDMRRGLEKFRGLLAQGCSSSMAREILGPLIMNYGKVRGFAETNPEGVLLHLYDDYITRAQSVNSRNITHGTPAAGSNLGSGTINRLTVNEDNLEIENIHLESKTAECVRDEHMGAEEHREVFRVRGENRQIDQILVDGSGIDQEITCIASDDSLISNPSFSQRSGTDTVITDLTDWTPLSGVYTSLNLDPTNYYRESSESDTTPKALKLVADEYVYQNFSVSNVNTDRYTPYYAQLAYNRETGAGNGTLRFLVGTQVASVVLAAQAGWNILRIAIGVNNWPKHFTKLDTPYVAVQLTGRTSGYVLVDDIVFAPYRRVDGTWYAPVGGATPFLRGDTFSWTDALAASDGIVQYYLWLAFGFAAPHNNAAAETWADPTV